MTWRRTTNSVICAHGAAGESFKFFLMEQSRSTIPKCHHLVASKQQRFISHNSMGKKNKLKVLTTVVHGRPISLFIVSAFLLYLHIIVEGTQLSRSSFIKA